MDVKLVGDKKVKLRIKGIPEKVRAKKIMSRIGNFLLTSIKSKTSKGEDVDGMKFKDYSVRYKFFRDKKGLPTNIVDLFFTGSMMSSMTYEAKKDEVRLFFLPTTDRKGTFNPEKAYYLNEGREFFAIGATDIIKIENMFQDHIRRSL